MGLHDYPLCQAGQWVASAAAALYLLDGGVVEGVTWEPQPLEGTAPPAPVSIVGRGSSAWNPELCVPMLPCLLYVYCPCSE